MPNTYLARYMQTEMETPAVAEWLIAIAGGWRSAAPASSLERRWSEAGPALAECLVHYRAHRAQGDPERATSHRALREYTAEILSALINSMRYRGLPTGAITEEQLRIALERPGHGGVCCDCAQCFASTSPETYCPVCKDRHYKKCDKCQRTNDRSQLLAVRNNVASADELHCRACATKLGPCRDCGRLTTGEPAGSAVLKPAELTAHRAGLCYVCARLYRRAKDCGHITHKECVVVDIENVEDDCGDERTQKARTVCPNCRDKDVSIEHFDASITMPSGGRVKRDEIGSDRTFGVELEICQAKNMPAIPKALKAYWTAKRDGSLPANNSVELASTILRGDQGLDVIKKMVDFAGEHGWAVNYKAGYHLHIGLEGMNQVQLAAVATGYLSTEKLWQCFVAKSRVGGEYSKPSRSGPDDFFRLASQDIHGRILANEDRYRWVNWQAYRKFGTLEIRLHQGTLVYEKIANWIKAHARFIDWCADGERPMRRVWLELRGRRASAKKMLKFIGEEVWRDPGLADWFYERAKVLGHGIGLIDGEEPTCEALYPEADRTDI